MRHRFVNLNCNEFELLKKFARMINRAIRVREKVPARKLQCRLLYVQILTPPNDSFNRSISINGRIKKQIFNCS